MNDYNYDLDVYTNNSNALIAQRITINTKILEFGPAYGRLTKYLHESLGCSIDIVEINCEAGQVAEKYSENSCLGNPDGDIETLVWEKRFLGNKYDYIIFADVLEHLKDPELVLKKCQLFLKEHGSILCSIPNIAHSSVILSLLNDDFTYKDYGLLDRTHISFFTRSTFRTLCKTCGYQVVQETAIKSEVGTNEIAFDYSSVPENIKNTLKMRKNGEAYQYIFELKKENIEPVNEFINSLAGSGWGATCLYRKKTENEYNLLARLTKHIYSLENDLYFELNEITELAGICLEPINSLCFLKLEGIFWGYDSQEIAISTFTSNGELIIDNCFAFLNDIPKIYITSPTDNVAYIHIKYKVFLYNTEDLTEIAGWFASYRKQADEAIKTANKNHLEEINQLKNTLKIQEETFFKVENEYQKVQSEEERLILENRLLQSEIRELNEKLKMANADGIDLKKQLNHYENLLRNKLFQKRNK